MAKFNADAQFEAIEVTLDGVDYQVAHVSKGLMTKIQGLDKIAESEEEKLDVVYQQLGMFLSVSPDTFYNTDFRKIRAILEYILGEFKGSLDSQKKT